METRFSYGKKLLGNLLDVSSSEIDEVINRRYYHRAERPKKNGGIRIINAPDPVLKKFQRQLLWKFFSRIEKRGMINCYLTGRKTQSFVTNANAHCYSSVKFALCLDLKDAFPSVKTEDVYIALLGIFDEECRKYLDLAETRAKLKVAREKDWDFLSWDEKWERSHLDNRVENLESELEMPFFSSNKARWFRDLFRPAAPTHAATPLPDQVLREFASLLALLLTWNGELPQGAPTSPFLLNLVVTRLNYIDLVQKILQKYDHTACRINMYVDNLTVSSEKKIDWQATNEIIALLESDGIFKVNKRKTRLFNINHRALFITGLNVARYHLSAEPVKPLWQFKKRERHRIRKNLKEGKRAMMYEVRPPKKMIKKIRGIIHRAKFDQTLLPQVEGYLGYLKGVLGDNLPNQITKPLAQLTGYGKNHEAS